MSTQDYALITSLLSIVIAIGALLWNVWQKFIFVKPNLQVSFGLYHVMQPISASVLTRSGDRLLVLTVTNMGPGVVVLYACVAKPKAHWWTRVKQLGMINPIHNDPTDPNPVSIGPFSSGLPTKIEAGDVKSFYFPYVKGCFLHEGLARVGINVTCSLKTRPGGDRVRT